MISPISDSENYSGYTYCEPCDLSFWFNKIKELEKVYVYTCKVCNSDKVFILSNYRKKYLVECSECKKRKVIYKAELVKVEHI